MVKNLIKKLKEMYGAWNDTDQYRFEWNETDSNASVVYFPGRKLKLKQQMKSLLVYFILNFIGAIPLYITANTVTLTANGPVPVIEFGGSTMMFVVIAMGITNFFLTEVYMRFKSKIEVIDEEMIADMAEQISGINGVEYELYSINNLRKQVFNPFDWSYTFTCQLATSAA